MKFKEGKENTDGSRLTRRPKSGTSGLRWQESGSGCKSNDLLKDCLRSVGPVQEGILVNSRVLGFPLDMVHRLMSRTGRIVSMAFCRVRFLLASSLLCELELERSLGIPSGSASTIVLP